MNPKNMLKAALKRYQGKCVNFNIHRFAKENDIAYSTVYTPCYEDRMPRVNTWLKIMDALGAVEVRGDYIVIRMK